MSIRGVLVASGVLLVSASLGVACGGSDASVSSGASDAQAARGLEPTGQACTGAAQCYPGVSTAADAGGIEGEVTCIAKVSGGYCSHLCVDDTSCCRAAGECTTGVKEVCSPIENQGEQYCFASCQEDDITRALTASPDTGYDAGSGADGFCERFAGTTTTCRSTGGGSKNRKVCLP